MIRKSLAIVMTILFIITSTMPFTLVNIVKSEETEDSVIAPLTNKPPTTPFITGETNGIVGVEYEYFFESVDPDGDDVYYIIDWGDGGESGIGPYPSGEQAMTTYIFEGIGTFTIRAKAVDIYGAMSNWAALEVSMPKSVYIEDQENNEQLD